MSVTFFFSKLTHGQGNLRIELESGRKLWGVVDFDFPRAFRFFNESDYYPYINNLDYEIMLSGTEGCWIGQSQNSPYLRDYCSSISESRLDDGLLSILVVTPQECVEVISFEPPSIKILDKTM